MMDTRVKIINIARAARRLRSSMMETRSFDAKIHIIVTVAVDMAVDLRDVLLQYYACGFSIFSAQWSECGAWGGSRASRCVRDYCSRREWI